MGTITEAARLVRASGPGPAALASVDQSAADWAEAFEVFGLDLHDERVAASAFVVAACFAGRLTEVSDPAVLLSILTSRIAEAIVAIAQFVS